MPLTLLCSISKGGKNHNPPKTNKNSLTDSFLHLLLQCLPELVPSINTAALCRGRTDQPPSYNKMHSGVPVQQLLTTRCLRHTLDSHPLPKLALLRIQKSRGLSGATRHRPLQVVFPGHRFSCHSRGLYSVSTGPFWPHLALTIRHCRGLLSPRSTRSGPPSGMPCPLYPPHLRLRPAHSTPTPTRLQNFSQPHNAATTPLHVSAKPRRGQNRSSLHDPAKGKSEYCTDSGFGVSLPSPPVCACFLSGK